MSLPTVIVTPQAGGNETDADFELDKRLSTRLSLQINIGYVQLPRVGTSRAEGWQNIETTLKFIIFSNREGEQLGSFSLTREFGRSGARRIGAEDIGATIGAINFGQGFASFAQMRGLQPFALTGSGGFLIVDRQTQDTVHEAILSASLQYSLDIFAKTPAGRSLPRVLQPFIPIVETSFALPVRGGRQRGLLAPGLIYAGDGYQLAAEALLPLTREAGTHAGFIAQLNVSLSVLGFNALARPLL